MVLVWLSSPSSSGTSSHCCHRPKWEAPVSSESMQADRRGSASPSPHPSSSLQILKAFRPSELATY